MTGRSLTPNELLRELDPFVAKAYDRHVEQAVAWFPHEYVPYERGRNFIDEPWKPEDSRLPDIAQIAIELNLLTEDNLPYYTVALTETFGKTEAWGEWVRRWTAEEGRHAIVLRDYLTVTRGVDPAAMETGRMDMVQRGWYPGFVEAGPVDGVIYTTLQELATRISHRNTGTVTQDEGALKILQRIATDENLHYLFYRDVATEALARHPSEMVLAMQRVVCNFAMPGTGIADFSRQARIIADAGIYDFSAHYHQILVPIVLQRWDVENLDGLSSEAAIARDALVAYIARIGKAASRLEARRERTAAKSEAG